MLTALVVLLALACIALAARLRWTRRTYARKLAYATGHPSTLARRDGDQLAAELATGLAELGLVADRSRMRVWAKGLAGEYAATVHFANQIAVVYRVHGGQEVILGLFGSIQQAIRAIAEHAELRAPA